MSAGFVQVIVWSAWLTVRVLEPFLSPKLSSPSKLAPTPPGYDPALIPERLALAIVATPLASVIALPTELPLRVKLMLLPATADESEVLVSFAEPFAARPKVHV